MSKSKEQTSESQEEVDEDVPIFEGEVVFKGDFDEE